MPDFQAILHALHSFPLSSSIFNSELLKTRGGLKMRVSLLLSGLALPHKSPVDMNLSTLQSKPEFIGNLHQFNKA